MQWRGESALCLSFPKKFQLAPVIPPEYPPFTWSPILDSILYSHPTKRGLHSKTFFFFFLWDDRTKDKVIFFRSVKGSLSVGKEFSQHFPFMDSSPSRPWIGNLVTNHLKISLSCWSPSWFERHMEENCLSPESHVLFPSHDTLIYLCEIQIC